MELRAVNGKGLKVSCKTPDLGPQFESDADGLIRKKLRRGSVNLTISAAGSRSASAPSLQLNHQAFTALWRQLQTSCQELGIDPTLFASSILSVPSIISSNSSETESDGLTQYALEQLTLLIDQFNAFRDREGDAMAVQLMRLTSFIRQELKQIIIDSPRNIAVYREKLLERARQISPCIGIDSIPDELLREIAVIADKCDIYEETSRLDCHLAEFEKNIQSRECDGRKLDFMCQEIAREINTIGSKANDFAISQRVIAMKSTTEQIREIVQNIE